MRVMIRLLTANGFAMPVAANTRSAFEPPLVELPGDPGSDVYELVFLRMLR